MCKDEDCGKKPEHPRQPGSSYHLLDQGRIFAELQLSTGDAFLDLGCGAGDYSMAAAQIVGAGGKVYALEKQEQRIADLTERIHSLGLPNIIPMAADMTQRLPLADVCIDVCLISTALHIPDVSKEMAGVFNEVFRVLNPHSPSGIEKQLG